MKFTGLSLFLFFFFAQLVAPVSLQSWGPSKQTAYSQSTVPAANASVYVGEMDPDLNKSQLVKPTPISVFGLLKIQKNVVVSFPDNTTELKNFTLNYISRFVTSPPTSFS